jgi:hypothetical protein
MGLIIIDRREKGETQHVVPVGMGEQHSKIVVGPFQELLAQQPYAGAGVDDYQVVLFGPDLDAGGAAAVLDIVLAGYGDRPPRAPEFYFHIGIILANNLCIIERAVTKVTLGCNFQAKVL